MGGRGSWAKGNGVEDEFETYELIDGIPVLRPKDRRWRLCLPVESKTSRKYILLDKSGVFHQYREYNEQHELVYEIGYHWERGISKAREHVLHVHDFPKPGIDYRGRARPIRRDEMEKYKHLFVGVKQ